MNPKEQPRIELASLKKILLIRLRRIGDIILTTPAITLLKKNLPQASLSYLVEKPYQRLVEGNPYLDEVIAIEKKQKGRDFLRFIRQIRKGQYDAVLDFHGGPRAFWTTLFSRARLKIGYQIKYKSFVYDIRIPRSQPASFIHSVENHVNLVRALGLKIPSTGIPPLFLPQAKKEEIERVKNILKENGLWNAKLVLLHISAGNKFRDWGVDNLVKLNSFLSGIAGIKVVLIGSEEDKKAGEEILQKSAFPVFSLVGQLSLSELKELMTRATLFVGPDSGPMHIAAAASLPVVAYFGPTLPAHFAPWQAKAVILEKEMNCRPCRQRRCIYEDFRCLRFIMPEEVFKACQPLL